MVLNPEVPQWSHASEVTNDVCNTDRNWKVKTLTWLV